jgi:hypothetical protein
MTAARSHKGGAKPTNLAGGITNSATSFAVATGGGTGYPDGSLGNFVITIDVTQASEEKILCSARSGDTFTVAASGRGYDDTTATTHGNNAVVSHTFSATEAQELNDHIVKTTQDDHTQYGLVKKTLAAARAALAHRSMQFWYGTDNDTLSVDDGTNWHDFPSKAVNDTAYLGIAATAADSAKLGGTAAASFQTTAAANAAYVAKTDPTSATVATSENVTNTAFVDLATVGPTVTVTIGASGKALVYLTAQLSNNTVGFDSNMGYVVSGASSVVAATARALRYTSPTANAFLRATAMVMQTGLTAGSNTFTAKYAATSGGTSNFINREIVVIPL